MDFDLKTLTLAGAAAEKCDALVMLVGEAFKPGKDPLSLGDTETVAEDMGFSKAQTKALQQVAHDQLAASQ